MLPINNKRRKEVEEDAWIDVITLHGIEQSYPYETWRV